MTQTAPHYALYGRGGRGAWVDRITPNNGPGAGGTRVEMQGRSLDRVTRVFFGAQEATALEHFTDHVIRCTSPPGLGNVPVHIFAPVAITVGQFFYNDEPRFDPLSLPWEYALAAAGPAFDALGLDDGAPVNAWPAERTTAGAPPSAGSNGVAGTYVAGPPPAVRRGAARGWYRGEHPPPYLFPPIVWAICARFEAPIAREGEESEYPEGSIGALQQNANNSLNLHTRPGDVERIRLWNPASGEAFGTNLPECPSGTHLFVTDVRVDRTLTLTIDGVVYDAPNLHVANFVFGASDLSGGQYFAESAAGDYYFYGLAKELTPAERAALLQWARDSYDVGRP